MRATVLAAALSWLAITGLILVAPSMRASQVGRAGTSQVAEVHGTRALLQPATTAPTPTAHPLASAPRLEPAPTVDQLGTEQDATSLAPVSISIERLGLVDVAVVPSGVDASGEMEIPPPRETGWYKFGPAPGQPGSAVIAGHIASQGINGAFRHLDDLEPGDAVSVTRDDGTSLTFRVDEVRQVGKTQLRFDDIFRDEGPARLALITCGGEFNYDERSYEDNLVVIAVPSAP